jgi:cyanophycinase
MGGLDLLAAAKSTHILCEAGRFGRLIESVALHPKAHRHWPGGRHQGLIRPGQPRRRLIGSNLVIILDGHTTSSTTTPSLCQKAPCFLENITMHVLAKATCTTCREHRCT